MALHRRAGIGHERANSTKRSEYARIRELGEPVLAQPREADLEARFMQALAALRITLRRGADAREQVEADE